MIACPKAYSEKYLIKHGGIRLPEDVIIYGKEHVGIAPFYQAGDLSRKAIMYGFEIRGDKMVSNFFHQLASDEIDTVMIHGENYSSYYFINYNEYVFLSTRVEVDNIQFVTGDMNTLKE
jgi:hypothetical protein